jgi:hypothetical protein
MLYSATTTSVFRNFRGFKTEKGSERFEVGAVNELGH